MTDKNYPALRAFVAACNEPGALVYVPETVLLAGITFDFTDSILLSEGDKVASLATPVPAGERVAIGLEYLAACSATDNLCNFLGLPATQETVVALLLARRW